MVINEWEELDKGKEEIEKWMKGVKKELDSPCDDPQTSPVVKRRQKIKVSVILCCTIYAY